MTEISRRSLLRGGAALGVAAVASTALGPTARGAAEPADGARLLIDYQPSQPTGWPTMPGQDDGTTLGGHRTAQDFEFNGKLHRISLLPAEPQYAPVPSSRFRQLLTAGFGDHYTFRYRGLSGQRRLRVESYSVFGNEAGPGARFGGGLYIVYDAPDATSHNGLQWIQMVSSSGEGRPADPVIDNMWRANPFFPYGGLTSVRGKQLVNYHDVPQAVIAGAVPLDDRFSCEAFLVEDTGRRDAARRAVIDILGGVTWGWQVQQLG